jgi:hypothetical protein
MDNFSAHNAAYEQLQRKAATKLKNTKVIFLPPNVTSRHQPLDQGVISAWKAHYKRAWLWFMVEEADRGRDPMDRIDVLKAIRWGIRAWHFEVTNEAVANCWIKSGLLGPVYGPEPAPKGHELYQQVGFEPDPVRSEVQSLIGKVSKQRGIQTVPNVDDFINPAAEIVEDDEETVEEVILEQILEAYDEDGSDDEEGVDEPIEKVTLEQAIEATRIRILYEEQHGDGEGDKLLQLERDMRLLSLKKIPPKARQASLFQWLQ